MKPITGVHISIAVALFAIALVGNGIAAYLAFALAALFAASALAQTFVADRMPNRLTSALGHLTTRRLPYFLMLVGLGLALLSEGRWWAIGGITVIYFAYLMLTYDITETLGSSGSRGRKRAGGAYGRATTL